MMSTRRVFPLANCLAALLTGGWFAYCQVNASMYYRPMRWAIFNGDNARLQTLLSKGAVPNGAAVEEEPLLYLAIARRNTAAVRSLLKRGADANSRHAGRSMLEHALHPQAEPELVSLLLDHGADLNETARVSSGRAGDPPPGERVWLVNGPMPPVVPAIVTRAVGVRDLKVLKLLLDRGAKVDGELGAGPLVAAINGDAGEKVRLLVARGANPNARLREEPLLSYACSLSREKAAIALLEMKSDPNATDPAGTTPLMQAARARRAELVRRLLRHGARVGLRDRAGLTALDHAEQELKRRMEGLAQGLKLMAKQQENTRELRYRLHRQADLDERRTIVRLLREARKP